MYASIYTPAEHPVKHSTSLVTLRGGLRWSIAMFFDSQTHSQFLRLNKLPGKLLSWQIWERNRRTRWIHLFGDISTFITQLFGGTKLDSYTDAYVYYTYIEYTHTRTHVRTHARTHARTHTHICIWSPCSVRFNHFIITSDITSHHIACILALHRYKRHLTTRYTCISTQCMINVK